MTLRLTDRAVTTVRHRNHGLRSADRCRQAQSLGSPGCHHAPCRLPPRPAVVQAGRPALGSNRFHPRRPARPQAKKGTPATHPVVGDEMRAHVGNTGREGPVWRRRDLRLDFLANSYKRDMQLSRPEGRTRLTLAASIASPPAYRDDRETPLRWAEMGEVYYDCRICQEQITTFRNRSGFQSDARSPCSRVTVFLRSRSRRDRAGWLRRPLPAPARSHLISRP
jgi:hypothetical protein